MTSNGSLTGPLTKERKNMASRLRGRLSLIFLTVLVAMLAFPAMAFAEPLDSSGGTSPAPTIQSDQADYSPGATVTLTGSNWQPGESVRIYVNDDVGQTWKRFDHGVKAEATMMGVVPHPKDPNQVFAISRVGQVFGTTDGGKTWTESRLPEGVRDCYAIACG